MNQSVGIVLVSHSAGLAAGLRELLGQMNPDGLPVAVAGGTADGRIGTSYEKILKAIGEADRGAGVLVLPDLGSSVLTALAVLEDHPRPDVLMVDAPFVEGAVAAVAAASGGAGLESVARAARQARQAAKFDETQREPAAIAAAGEPPAQETSAHQASAQVVLPANLHARPAGRLAREAANYTSTIRIEHAGKAIDPIGVLAVMSLGAKLGSTVTVHADGPDAEEAVKALSAVLAQAE
jgi:dihydroxyacetone kinase phosphotransfer subunit